MEAIAKLKASVKIPVIGNGDVVDSESYKEGYYILIKYQNYFNICFKIFKLSSMLGLVAISGRNSLAFGISAVYHKRCLRIYRVKAGGKGGNYVAPWSS